MIRDFNKIAEDLDKKFIWSKVTETTKVNEKKKWTTIVFGECGQGKSTLLNEIV